MGRSPELDGRKDLGMQERDRDQTVLERFRHIAENHPEETITFDVFAKDLGPRGYGLLFLLLDLPNLIPLPIPGPSTVFGIPLAFVSFQLMLGLERPWFPKFLLNKGLRRGDLLRFCDKVEPGYARIHRFLKPRLDFLTNGHMTRLTGAAIFALASVMVLPIPLGNLILAIPIGLLALSLVERDGLFMLLGLVAGAIGLAVNTLIGFSVLYGLFIAVEKFLGIGV